MSRVLCRSIPCITLAFLMAGCTPTQHAKSTQNTSPQATAPALPSPTPEQKQAASAQQAKTQQEQRVQSLIEQVEKAYTDGQLSYRKGNLPAAKSEFDRAVDLMLTSGIDIKGEPQLQDEFDRIVDAVNALEMEALKQGNGFAPKEEPTPADVASDVTFAVDPNIVAKADRKSTRSEETYVG